MTDPAPELRAGGRICPSCATPMQHGDFEHRDGRSGDLELCLDCRAIWFDAFESPQLAPAAIVALFQVVQSAKERPARPLAASLHCPACRDRLDLTHDIAHTTRFSYYRCREGHGRFTTFVQFLREKEFVRALAPVEIERLRATVQQVRCTSCGGAVDLARDPACPYCGAAVEILDADAVERTLARLGTAQPERPRADPARILEALVARAPRQARTSPWIPGGPAGYDSSILDLVSDAIDLVIPSHSGDFS